MKRKEKQTLKDARDKKKRKRNRIEKKKKLINII